MKDHFCLWKQMFTFCLYLQPRWRCCVWCLQTGRKPLSPTHQNMCFWKISNSKQFSEKQKTTTFFSVTRFSLKRSDSGKFGTGKRPMWLLDAKGSKRQLSWTATWILLSSMAFQCECEYLCLELVEKKSWITIKRRPSHRHEEEKKENVWHITLTL